MSTHIPDPPPVLLDCEFSSCGRVGNKGFKIKDHLKEHYRKVHGEERKVSRSDRGERKEAKIPGKDMENHRRT